MDPNSYVEPEPIRRAGDDCARRRHTPGDGAVEETEDLMYDAIRVGEHQADEVTGESRRRRSDSQTVKYFSRQLRRRRGAETREEVRVHAYSHRRRGSVHTRRRGNTGISTTTRRRRTS